MDERLKKIEDSVEVSYVGLELGTAKITLDDFNWLIAEVKDQTEWVRHYKELKDKKNKVIDHFEKTIKEASRFLINHSGTVGEPRRLTIGEMTELYILLVDSLGVNDGRHFTNSK